MKLRLLLLPALLAFGTAGAQTAAPATAVSVTANLNVLVNLVKSGAEVTLVEADGDVVATLQADGTFELAEGMTDLQTATAVKVSTPVEGAEARVTTYTLASAHTLDQNGQPKVAVTNAAGKVIRVALPAAVNRQAASPEAPSTPPSEPTVPTEPVQDAASAGKGKGRSK